MQSEQSTSKTYKYSVSTNTLWASFDFGEVQARSIEEAKVLAIEKITEDFEKANEAFAQCENTRGFSIDFNADEIQITE
jgi:hypothetical protein